MATIKKNNEPVKKGKKMTSKNISNVEKDHAQFLKSYQPTFFTHYYRLRSSRDSWKAIGNAHSLPKVLSNIDETFFMDASTLFRGTTIIKGGTYTISIDKQKEKHYIGSLDDNAKRSTIFLITHSDKSYIEMLVSKRETPNNVYDLMEDGVFDLDITYFRAMYNPKK